MASPSLSFKTPNSIHIFSMKAPSSLTSTKLKTLFQNLVFSRVCRISRALGKVKSFLLKLAKEARITIHLVDFPIVGKRRNKNGKLFFGSFRLHYNWCSSHVMPLGSCDNSWNRPFDTCHQDCGGEDQLSTYLQWLEDNKGDNHNHYDEECNEIDKLADLFIANCHEKFRLEKQESYRRFQQMLATSVVCDDF